MLYQMNRNVFQSKLNLCGVIYHLDSTLKTNTLTHVLDFLLVNYWAYTK